MSIPDFTPKEWVDEPDHSTPINAAGLIDLETRVTAYSRSLLGSGGGGGGAPTIVTAPGDPAPDPSLYADGTLWIERI